MRKSIFNLLLVTILFLSQGCSSDSDSDSERVFLNVDETELIFTDTNEQTVTISTNAGWATQPITPQGVNVWFTVLPSSGSAGEYSILVTPLNANTGTTERTGSLLITAGGISRTVELRQRPLTVPEPQTTFYNEGEVVNLQRASVGNGVNLLLMGDGFTRQDMDREDGRYEQVMRQAMQHFFDVEPYRSYRNYFNVDMMIAISAQAGVGNAPGEVNNRFGSYFGEGTLIEFNFNECKEFALRAYQGTNIREGDITVGLILNSTEYAGTATMESDGFSITRCPMSSLPAPNNFRGIIHHELGGHGFARAADEYVYTEQTVPANEVADTRVWQENFNAFRNVDFTDNLSAILWSDFIGRPRYANVGAFEGALTYSTGVWKPEVNSCMNNNVPYYNGPTRWMAVERITRIAGTPFSFEQFVANDVIDISAQAVATSRAYEQSAPPLHRPILIE